MGRGHKLDADTFALYRMDATAVASYDPLIDLVSGYSFSAPVNQTVQPMITNGPAGTRYARGFDNGDELRGPTAAGRDLTMALGEWTIEVFIRPIATGGGTIVSLSTGGELEINNTILSARFTSGGALQVFWEHGAGINDVIQTASGGHIVINGSTWYHLAYAKTATSILFYVNGVLVDTVAYSNNATGGSGSIWRVGRDASDSSGFSAIMKDLRISDVARSGSEIAADAALISSTAEHPNDSDTHLLLRMSEAPDLIDETSKGLHLRSFSMADIDTGIRPFIQDGGYARFHRTSGAPASTGYTSGFQPYDLNAVALRTALLGSFTWEYWLQEDVPYEAVRRGLFVFKSSTSGTLAVNQISIDVMTTRAIQVFSEHGAGVNDVYLSTWVIPHTDAPQWNHLAVVKSGAGSTYVVKLYWNGELVETSSALTQYEGGTTNTMRLMAGALEGEWRGSVDDVRLSNKERTAAEIKDSYLRGIGAPDYWMRAFDSGLNDYVQWGPTTDPTNWLTPSAGETEPNFTGTLSDVHWWARTDSP